MSDIRLQKITIEKNDVPLVFQKGTLLISNTSSSIASNSGALVVNGGIGINNSINSTSNTSGGAITIAGGAGIMKDLYVGQNLVIDNSISALRVTGLSNDRLKLDNFSFTLSPNGVSKRFEVSNTQVNILMSQRSSSSSTGALVIQGGLGITSSESASSITVGGGLTLAGGAAIGDNLFVGNGIISLTSNTLGAIVTTDGNVGIGIASPTVTLDVSGSLRITSGSLNATGSVNTVGSIFTTGGNVGIGTNSPTAKLDVSGSTRLSGNLTLGGTIIPSNDVTFDLGSLQNRWRDIYLSQNNIFYLGDNQLRVTGGTLVFDGPIVSQTTGSFASFSADGISVSSNKVISFPTTGNVGIGTTVPSEKLDVSGVLRITSGGLNATWNSNTLGSLFTTGGNIGIATTSPLARLSITPRDFETKIVLYDNGSTSSSFNFGITSNQLNFKIPSSSDSHVFSTVDSEIIRFVGNGNVGIGTSSPGSRLDVSGNLRITSGSLLATSSDNTIGSIRTSSTGITIGNDLLVNGMSNFNNIVRLNNITESTSSSTGILIINGGLGINLDTNAISLTSGGALTVAGGIAVQQDTFIGGHLYLKNGTSSSSSTNGALVVDGGIAIKSTSNASGFTQGGALTIGGGASFGKDVWISGKLTGKDTEFANVIITDTALATSGSTGALVSYGGIGIASSDNSAFFVAGGVTIGKNISVGGTSTLNDTVSIITSSDNFSITELYRTSKSQKVIGMNYITSDNSINLARYTGGSTLLERSIELSLETGRLLFNNTIGSSNMTTGSLILKGGLTISNSSQSTSQTSGGAITVVGGAGIGRDVYIGGNVRVNSSSVSSSVNTGAIIVNGGVGISGQLNVGGSAVIVGDLTVQGQTQLINSVQTEFEDNIMMLNAGPSGTRDSGFIISRYQISNSSGTGDVVTDGGIQILLPPTVPSDLTESQIQFPSTVDIIIVDDYYKGWWIKTLTGNVRKIVAYNGTTKIATVDTPWTLGGGLQPGPSETVRLYNKVYVGVIFNEQSDAFEFGSMVTNPVSQVSFTDYIPIKSSKVSVSSTENATTSDSGALTVAGGVGIGRSLFVGGDVSFRSTTQANGLGTGGSLTVFGGASIAKDVFVGGTVTSSSDERLKKDIENYFDNTQTSVLDSINDIRTVSFNYKNDPDHTKHMGFIAQDFLHKFPELVKTDPSGFHYLDYAKITVVLMECIKELKQELSQIRQKN